MFSLKEIVFINILCVAVWKLLIWNNYFIYLLVYKRILNYFH